MNHWDCKAQENAHGAELGITEGALTASSPTED